MTIKLIGMLTTIFGSILNPLVSSSKNLIKPPLDAGSGADFLSAMAISQTNEFDINTLLVGINLALNQKYSQF
jgi:hypothetical protein